MDKDYSKQPESKGEWVDWLRNASKGMWEKRADEILLAIDAAEREAVENARNEIVRELDWIIEHSAGGSTKAHLRKTVELLRQAPDLLLPPSTAAGECKHEWQYLITYRVCSICHETQYGTFRQAAVGCTCRNDNTRFPLAISHYEDCPLASPPPAPETTGLEGGK